MTEKELRKKAIDIAWDVWYHIGDITEDIETENFERIVFPTIKILLQEIAEGKDPNHSPFLKNF